MLPSAIISLVITALLVCGVRESTRFNNVMVIIKLSVVLFVICLGAAFVDTDNFSPFAPYGYLGLSFFGHRVAGGEASSGKAAGVLAGAAISYFGQSKGSNATAALISCAACLIGLPTCVLLTRCAAYIGFDSVSCQAEEARKPERDLPIAILLSLGISTALYVGVSIVLVGMVNWREINVSAPLSTAFSQRGVYWAAYLIAIGAVVGILSVQLTCMLAQPRIFLAMSRDKLLPPFFGSVHPRYLTPWKATILTGVAVAILSSTIPLSILVEFVSIGTLAAFTFVCISVIVLRYTAPQLPRPFRCPLVPLIPILGILCCLTLAFSLPAVNWYRLLGWWAIGVIIYLFYGRKHGIGHLHRSAINALMQAKSCESESTQHNIDSHRLGSLAGVLLVMC